MRSTSAPKYLHLNVHPHGTQPGMAHILVCLASGVRRIGFWPFPRFPGESSNFPMPGDSPSSTSKTTPSPGKLGVFRMFQSMRHLLQVRGNIPKRHPTSPTSPSHQASKPPHDPAGLGARGDQLFGQGLVPPGTAHRRTGAQRRAPRVHRIRSGEVLEVTSFVTGPLGFGRVDEQRT